LTWQSSRLALLSERDAPGAVLVGRLLEIAQQALPQMYSGGEFVFTRRGARQPDGSWQAAPEGRSLRYGAMTALGLLHLPEEFQRAVLEGESCHELIARLAKRLGEVTNLGDAAVVSWAAAEAAHPDLPYTLRRLSELDGDGPYQVVEAAWVVSALVAARSHADVEKHLTAARQRLLGARGAVAYPHTTGRGGVPWYRTHVGSFAAQVYPVQALARLHASADDPQALAAANRVAGAICVAQGKAGQWWWHYDARTGAVVEGYPVYTVHQHAMGPMALFDLAEAGGENHLDAICLGLHWLDGPPETTESMLPADLPITWRKVARGDRGKVIRGVRAASTRVSPGTRLTVLDRIAPPGPVDHECRPYELGWLLYTWL
jgi:hypothetical protein